jgi:hypothetical protein
MQSKYYFLRLAKNYMENGTYDLQATKQKHSKDTKLLIQANLQALDIWRW